MMRDIQFNGSFYYILEVPYTKYQIPNTVSAGGGLFPLAACCGFDLCHKYILYLYFPEDDDILQCGADRNGRQWLRVELSSPLLKYRTALTWQLWKRRPNGVFAQAT